MKTLYICVYFVVISVYLYILIDGIRIRTREIFSRNCEIDENDFFMSGTDRKSE